MGREQQKVDMTIASEICLVRFGGGILHISLCSEQYYVQSELSLLVRGAC